MKLWLLGEFIKKLILGGKYDFGIDWDYIYSKILHVNILFDELFQVKVI